MTTIVQDAVDLAELGLWVFPCKSDKRPLTKHGFKDAVNDPIEVAALFESFGNRAELIGVKTGPDSDLIALDFDFYKGDEAAAYFEDLDKRKLLGKTRVHNTKSGGVHILYRGNRGNGAGYPNVVPNEGVEVRGDGGYIIWWPAHGCPLKNDTKIAKASPKLIKHLTQAKRTASKDSLSDLHARIVAATDFHDSISRYTARLAGAGKDRAAITEAVHSAMMSSVAASSAHPRHERWRAILEDTTGELSRAITSAYVKYNPSAVGEDVEGLFTEKLREAADRAGFRPQPQTPEGGDDVLQIPAIEDIEGWPFEDQGYFAHVKHDLLKQKFILHPLFCEDESILISAEPKTGKTALALTAGLHVACGIDLGPSLRVPEPRGVLYLGLEGRRAIRLRIQAWREHMEAQGVEVPEFIPLFVVETGKNLMEEAVRQTLANQIAAASIHMEKEHAVSLGAIFIDTFTKAMPGGDQNSVEATSLVFDLVNRVRDTGVTASVAFIHHKGKAGNVRGSTNIEADPDVLTSISKEGNHVVWSLDRARSVEEGGAYHFELLNHPLGESEQGYEINAPVATAVDGVAAFNSEFTSAVNISQTMSLILTLGVGTHPLSLILKMLKNAGLGPVSTNRRGPNITASSKLGQAFFSDLIPETGYSFGGRTVERIVDMDTLKILSLHIR